MTSFSWPPTFWKRERGSRPWHVWHACRGWWTYSNPNEIESRAVSICGHGGFLPDLDGNPDVVCGACHALVDLPPERVLILLGSVNESLLGMLGGTQTYDKKKRKQLGKIFKDLGARWMPPGMCTGMWFYADDSHYQHEHRDVMGPKEDPEYWHRSWRERLRNLSDDELTRQFNHEEARMLVGWDSWLPDVKAELIRRKERP